MKKRIIIAGATGFIGKRLAHKLFSLGYEITIITRDINKSKTLFPNFSSIDWKLSDDLFTDAFEDCYGIINLAGASLADKRWTDNYKKVIINSRVQTTERIVRTIEYCKTKPQFLINASAIGYYGNRGDEILTENSKKGEGFLSDVCLLWEESVIPAKKFTRLVIPRIGIVLDKKEGALAKMMLPFKLFFGGNLGSAKDWISWIHIEDLVSLFIWTINNDKISDHINFVSSNPTQKKDFNRILGKVLKRPNWFVVPQIALKLLLGEASEMLISSQRVIPEKAISFGFDFEFDEIDYALFSLIKNKYIKYV